MFTGHTDFKVQQDGASSPICYVTPLNRTSSVVMPPATVSIDSDHSNTVKTGQLNKC